MDILKFLSNLKVKNYYQYLLSLSGALVILALLFDLKAIDNIYILKISVLVIISSIFVWLSEAVIHHINLYLYENSIQEGMELLANKKHIRLNYNKNVFILSIISVIFQLLIWISVIVLSYFAVKKN